MVDVLVVAILAIGLVFVGLTGLIVGNKAWREAGERRRERRRRELEPAVLAWVHGDGSSLTAALGGVPAGVDRIVVEEILRDHLQRVRGIERERLARAYDELGFVAAALARLASRRWWNRADAAERLGLGGAARAAGALARALDDEVFEVRMRAAKALGVLGDPTAARALVHALDDPSRWSTIRVADILTVLGRAAVPALTDGWSGLGRTGRLAALDVLGRIRPLAAVPWLVEHLADADDDVRARTCHALGAIGDPETAEPLIRALGDRAWPVRAMAAKALGRMGSDAALPWLRRALGDPEWWVRSNAARALLALGSRGLDALEAALDDEDRFARHQAVLMLEEMGVVDAWVRRLEAGGPEAARAEAFVRKLVAAGPTGRLEALARRGRDAAGSTALAVLLGERAEA